jgi:ATP-dependent RNA helicase DHX8/PRP22
MDSFLSILALTLASTARCRAWHPNLKGRPDVKLIVNSATHGAEKFSKCFFGCPIFTMPGQTYPIKGLYTKEPESDYLDASLITVMQIHLSEPPGDILLFLMGQEEIGTAWEILFEHMKALGPKVPELIILPIYSALPSEVQSRVFDLTLHPQALVKPSLLPMLPKRV